MATPQGLALDWHAEDLWLASRELIEGLSIELLAQTGSTNADALQRLRGGDARPSLIVAESQSAGRGRLGRSWWSAPGASLTFSLALALAPRDWGGLSLAVGLALAEAFDAPGPDSASRIGLKWPNDLWLRHDERKLAGILIETAPLPAAAVDSGADLPLWASPDRPAETLAGRADARHVVIGIGVNIVALAPDLAQDTSRFGSGHAALQEINADLDAPAALARLLPVLLRALRRFEREGLAPLRPAYAARDVLLGRTVQAGEQRGRAAGIDVDGALLIDTAPAGASAQLQRVHAGEVSVRPC
jgi:BirA family biotin operon repressor/biotin-[acetyl-CoA-carboxylase] ligase